MDRFFFILLLSSCVITSSSSSQQNKNRERYQQIRKIWDDVKSTPKHLDENFYEFVNRVTHGKMFNLSVEAHEILEVSRFSFNSKQFKANSLTIRSFHKAGLNVRKFCRLIR